MDNFEIHKSEEEDEYCLDDHNKTVRFDDSQEDKDFDMMLDLL
jgi:hypothetical protein